MATVDRLELFYSFEWRLCMNEEIKIASHLLCHDICLLSLKLPKVKKKSISDVVFQNSNLLFRPEAI